MTSPAVSLAPAARLAHVVGGRRALRLALLFGGLIVLCLLCGGRAQASGSTDGLVPAAGLSAEPRLPAAQKPVGQSAEKRVEQSEKHLRKPVRQAAQKVAQKTGQRPAREAVTKAARTTGAVVHRVRDTADTVDEVAERAEARTTRTPLTGTVRTAVGTTVRSAVRHVVEPVEELAGEVARPLPEVPGLPGAGAEPSAPSAGVTVPGPAPAERVASQHPTVTTAQRSAGATGCDPVRFDDGSATGAGQPAAGVRHTAARPAAPSVPPGPDNAPVANASLGDGGSTRHGDLHAAAFGSRVPVLLTPGATASGDASPVLDRLREIPSFPG
ncbi:hypothetical protein ABT127_22400 [Streptomyces sp. NPDC001904]|uniref:hypothetical protein n=1 Tax=Streptomyces sp. NPDC001904 TaxID=3154531 RepID=UPI00331EDC55